MRKRFPNEKGQSLVEVLVALAVLVLVILALVQVTIVSVRNASFAKNQVLATKYAQEWIEEARQLRDENPSDFFTDSFATSSCTSLDDYPDGAIFDRDRTCTLSVDGDKRTMTVLVTVSWTEGSKSFQSELKTYLTNWK